MSPGEIHAASVAKEAAQETARVARATAWATKAQDDWSQRYSKQISYCAEYMGLQPYRVYPSEEQTKEVLRMQIEECLTSNGAPVRPTRDEYTGQ